jgi:hypothetical protein
MKSLGDTENFAAQYDAKMSEWDMLHGLGGWNAQPGPESATPVGPAGFTPTGDPVADQFSYASAAQQEDSNRLGIARRENAKIRKAQNSAMGEALARGVATPADVQRQFDEGRIDYEQYQSQMDAYYRNQANERQYRATRGMTR